MIVKLKMQRLFRGKMMKIWNRTWTFLHRAQQELYSKKSFILEEEYHSTEALIVLAVPGSTIKNLIKLVLSVLS